MNIRRDFNNKAYIIDIVRIVAMQMLQASQRKKAKEQ